MEKHNLLITSVGGDVACAALRCIQEIRKYYHIVGCDINCPVQGQMYVDEFLIAPRYTDMDDYLTFIKKTCVQYDIDVFLPIGEREIELADNISAFFNDHRIAVMALDRKIVDIGLSKYKTSLFCKDIGVNTPETIEIESARKMEADEIISRLGLPLICKKVSGSGSKGLQHVKDVEMLEDFLSSHADGNDYLLQQEIGNVNDEYTMGVFSDGKDVYSLTFRRWLGFGSMSIKVENVIDLKFQEIAEKLAKNLNLKGSMNVQMRKRNGQYYVFEINPRISSSCRFRHLYGFKDVVWWLLMTDRRLGDIRYFPVREKYMSIKTLDESVYNNGNLITEEIENRGVQRYLSPVFRASMQNKDSDIHLEYRVA